MTTNVRDMPAGPVMDVMVAKAVMGWRVYRLRYVGKTIGGSPDRFQIMGDAAAEVFRRLGDYEVTLAEDTPLHEVSVQGLPGCTTHRSSALDALELWEGDYEIRRQNGQFRVELFRPSEEFKAWAETLPLAACRALLLAAQRDGLV